VELRVYDLVSGTFGVKTGTIGKGFDKEGSFVSADGGDSILFADVVHDIGTGAYTMAARYTWDGDAASFQTIMSLPNNSEVGIYWNVSNLRQDTLGDSTCIFSGTLATANQAATLSISSSGSGVNPEGYQDGVNFIGNKTMLYTEGGTTGITLFTGQGSEYAHGKGTWFALWSRQLTNAEQKSLHDFPYQILKPVIPLQYFTPEEDGVTTTPKALSQSAVGTASLAKALDLLNSPDMGGIGTASLSLVVTHFHAASMVAVGTSTIAKLIRKTLGFVATGTSSILKKVSKTLGYSATGTATQDEGIAVEQSASMSGTGTSTLVTLFIAGVVGAISFVRRIAIRLGLGL